MDGARARKPQEKPKLFEVVSGLEELNFVEFPMALLAKRAPNGVKTLRFEDSILDASTGKRVHRRVTISAADALSLPTWQDQDVFLALMILTKEKTGFESEQVPFTLYEVCKLLRWPTSGPYCNRVKAALQRWNGTWMCFENSFRRGGRWTSEKGFHVISYYELTKGQEFDPEREQTFDWHRLVVESVRASHTKGLDWDFYLGLKLPSTKRLYRFLDKRMWDRNTYNAPLVRFCQEKMGFGRSYKPNRYRDLLRPAIEELTAHRFLAEIPPDKLFVREGHGTYRVNFRRYSSGGKRRRSELVEATGLEKILIERGITPRTSRMLCATYQEERIREKVELVDWYAAKGSKKTAGWLRKAIEDDYSVPAGFQSKAEREARLRSVEQKRRHESKQREREESDQKAKHEEEDLRLSAFMESLGSDAQREEFEKKAVEGATKILRTMYGRTKRDGGKVHEGYRIAILKQHVQALDTGE